jgi:hypothetical protein
MRWFVLKSIQECLQNSDSAGLSFYAVAFGLVGLMDVLKAGEGRGRREERRGKGGDGTDTFVCIKNLIS